MARRIAQSKTWFALVLSILVLVASSVALVVAVGLNASQRAATDTKICKAVNRVNTTIEQQLRRSQQTLPTLSYYKAHPDELTTQLELINDEIVAFKPLNCKVG